MPSQRAILLLAGAALTAATAMPAAAQVSDEVVLNIMRECAKIDDPTARLACYDNNIGNGARNVPGQSPRPRGGGAPVAGSQGGPEGFGAESIRTPERFQSYEERGQGPDEIRARVIGVLERQPGVYIVTLEGGAQWLYTESAGRSALAPRIGDTAEIKHAALGSFMLMVNDQQGVHVRRIR